MTPVYNVQLVFIVAQCKLLNMERLQKQNSDIFTRI